MPSVSIGSRILCLLPSAREAEREGKTKQSRMLRRRKKKGQKKTTTTTRVRSTPLSGRYLSSPLGYDSSSVCDDKIPWAAMAVAKQRDTIEAPLAASDTQEILASTAELFVKETGVAEAESGRTIGVHAVLPV